MTRGHTSTGATLKVLGLFEILSDDKMITFKMMNHVISELIYQNQTGPFMQQWSKF